MDGPLAPTVPDGGDAEEGELPSRLGHFEVIGRLGSGGMGLVFEGRDLVLDRRVALKLLHPGRVGNPIAPARLLREAQALAKLSHRNVVTVYEVGMAGDDPFVAMELVEGETLAAWMRAPREWRAVLDVFIAVGHGLAAVHAIGLVHRDFKPSNVLFDKDGTPKLGDFGLVRPVEAPPDAAAEPADARSKLTETGSIMGTPAYMAPEQRLGLSVDTRADQYSFARSLSEALGEPVPAKLQPILARALADDPGARYPSMAPLLDALAGVRRGKRARWLVAGGAAAVLGSVALAWGLGRAQSTAVDACPVPTQRVAKVWGPQRRDGLRAHLLAIDPVLGARRFAAAGGVFDRGAARWTGQYVDACQSARAGRQSDALLDRRMGCLDRALLEIDDSVAVLERATDRTMLDDAMRAAVALPALDDCADVDALMELLPRPTNPVQRAEADALSRESVDIDVARRAGGTRTTNAEERAQAAVVRARTLDDPETLARALSSLAAVQSFNESGAVTLATLEEAITTAARAHDDRMVADLWTRLLTTLVIQKQPERALTLLPAAEAAVARTPTTITLQTDFLNAKAKVASANGDVATARAALDDALALLDAAGASAPSSSLRRLLIPIKVQAAVLHAKTGDFQAMAAGLRDAIALTTELFGPDYPSTMQMHWNLGVALRRAGDDEGALTSFREAARVGEARLSPSPALADYLYGVGSTLLAMEHNDAALPYLERATAMARATLPPQDPRLADPVGALAGAYLNLKRLEEAHPLLDEQIAILEKRGGTADDRLAIAYWNLGEVATLSKQCDLAASAYDKSNAAYRAIGTKDFVYTAMGSLAECQLATEAWAVAQRTTEQILAAKDVPEDQRVLARFNHGRAVAMQGRRRAGIAEVRAARPDMVRLEMTKVLPTLDDWLTAWEPPGTPRPQ